jgi:hypothetical protein
MYVTYLRQPNASSIKFVLNFILHYFAKLNKIIFKEERAE